MSRLSKNDLCAVAAGIICYKKILKRKTRTKWCKSWLLKRYLYSHVNILNELKGESDDWRNFLRMDEDCYVHLLNLVTPIIKKQNTRMRKAISPHERLVATLRFLATGRCYEDLKFSATISAQALGKIIPETCEAIFQVLKNEYMKFPTTEDDWLNIAMKFEIMWQFPHCLGSVDGKHIRITPPAHSGSFYYNYKGYHSLVLMAVVNANYEFVLCDIGTNGRISDGGVIENTKFYSKLKEKSLNIPAHKQLDNTQVTLPYVFIGDEAFALREDFLKPYSKAELNKEKQIFNYRLSRARRTVENAFGILAARFRVLYTAINLQPERIEKVVLACCVLHNYLRRKSGSNYILPKDVDREDTENGTLTLGERADPELIAGLKQGPNRNSLNSAKIVRNLFMQYFNNEGKIKWQDQMIMQKL